MVERNNLGPEKSAVGLHETQLYILGHGREGVDQRGVGGVVFEKAL